MTVLENTGWTDEARAASLAVRQAKAVKRADGGQKRSPTRDQSPKTGDGGPEIGDPTGDKGQRKLDRYGRPERTLEEQAAWDAKKRAMFQKQRVLSGEKFVGNWYPRGLDGLDRDPHWADTSWVDEVAPYGYHDKTGEPRQEPLYDVDGWPIVPAASEVAKYMDFASYQPDDRRADDPAWKALQDKANQEWGRFGEKKKWMDAHPGATEADWTAEQDRRFPKRKPLTPEQRERMDDLAWRRYEAEKKTGAGLQKHLALAELHLEEARQRHHEQSDPVYEAKQALNMVRMEIEGMRADREAMGMNVSQAVYEQLKRGQEATAKAERQRKDWDEWGSGVPYELSGPVLRKARLAKEKAVAAAARAALKGGKR